MEFIQLLQTYSKSDISQGKWMIGIAILIILPACILIIRAGNSLQKGMLIPLVLLFLMNVTYGGYLLFSKPKHLEQTEKKFQFNPQETVASELAKIQAEDKSYTTTKLVWAGLLIVSVLCYFIFRKEYLQGLSLGFSLMFTGMLLIDVFLHTRLKSYLENFF